MMEDRRTKGPLIAIGKRWRIGGPKPYGHLTNDVAEVRRAEKEGKYVREEPKD